MGKTEDIANEVSSVLSAKKQRNILIIILLLLFIGLAFGFNRYSRLTTQLAISEQNKKALADSVRVSENKVKDLVYSKNILIAEKGNLEQLNADLAAEVEKEKGKVREITRIVSEIKSDTVYITNMLIEYADGTKGLSWEHDSLFDTNNERHIAGVSRFDIDSNGVVSPLETTITKDDFKFNIVTGLVERNGNVEIFVRSDYPNFTVSQLDGAIIDPKKHPVMKKFTKPKKWGIGPYVGVGIGVNTWPNTNVGVGFQFGVGVTYSLFRF